MCVGWRVFSSARIRRADDYKVNADSMLGLCRAGAGHRCVDAAILASERLRANCGTRLDNRVNSGGLSGSNSSWRCDALSQVVVLLHHQDPPRKCFISAGLTAQSRRRQRSIPIPACGGAGAHRHLDYRIGFARKAPVQLADIGRAAICRAAELHAIFNQGIPPQLPA